MDAYRAAFRHWFGLVLSYQVLVVPGDVVVRREVAEAAVQAAPVVEGFKVVEDCLAGEFFGFEHTVFRETSAFQTRKK